ncbi:hypothetical protein N7466_004518 [Penicillium verhagenii]|uniref:uncharacterized protein n=1 Tax=Penicillium verhagenii TaxID=1562060 RepID=UPI0025456748|nr:uncharacterized protein N7466_004518 [Penicillium verhagenii]KAJ5934971.1 hypothetical protein N7466_004518 [Penicillium verhagenii]
MAYFLPSFFQKRLLKYALSRLGLVDTEALDLDNLGIRWGQRSTVELRDIGLKLEFLRITVPADIYSSGIICEINGINVHLRCLPDEPPTARHEKSKSQSLTAQGVHGLGEEQTLPTPSHLAESFLEAEPQEEKEELQAALSSQSHVFQRSSLFAEEEEEEELGLGNDTLSLPSFVAGFLKGVADRFQLSIKDVSVRLDMELKQDAPSKRQPEDRPDLVAGFLSVGEIDVHGVSGVTASSDNHTPLREGKRLISLANISVGLVSDPVVFANYSRFTAPTSPATTMQSKESQTSSRAPSPPLLDSPGSESALAMTRSTIFDPRPEFSQASIPDNELDTSAVFSHDGRFSDADSEADHRFDHFPDDSQVFGNHDPFSDNPGYLDSVIDAHFDDFDVESPEMGHSDHHVDASPGSSILLRHPLNANQEAAEHSHVKLAHSEPHLEVQTEYQVSDLSQANQQKPAASGMAESTHWSSHLEEGIPEVTAKPQNSSRVSASSSSSESEDGVSESATPDAELLESKYFSHDEAQSLYMSALSQGTAHSFMPNMPGAWDSFDAGEQSKPNSMQHPESRKPHSMDSSQDFQDETTASTPRLTAPSDSYFDEQRTVGDQTQSKSRLSDRDSTPSSPVLHRTSEIKKPILNIDKLRVWLPSAASEEETGDYTPTRASFESADGDSQDLAYGVEESMFASKTYASSRFQRAPTESPAFTEAGRSDQVNANVDDHLQRLEVEVSSIITHFDIATGWLLIKAGQRILQMNDGAGKDQPKEPLVEDQSSPRLPLDLTIHDLSIKFVEHVPGYPHSIGNDISSPPRPYTNMEEIVLQINASGLRANLSADEKRTNFHLGISKFTFGFASDDLVSFNESLRMRESTRDLATPSQGDISFSMTKMTDSSKIDIITLPIYLNLNIQRLEEVLGWMGGLSTILELGSSISSTSTMKGGHKPPKKRPRGVHFETPSHAPEKEQQSSSQMKVNARLGGVVLDVTGETHYLNLSTTAVKIVSRFEGIGAQIDKAQLIGPLPLDDFSDAPVKVTLNNIRVEFLFAPKEVDLDRLLTLITPSQDKYDDEDDIMVDTLLRQRRQGSVLRTTVGGMKTVVSSIDGLAPLPFLMSELSRLSTVTKYLPEDDRPGILTLSLVREFDLQVDVGGDVGYINAHIANAEAAWISMPSLIATQIGAIRLIRNDDEELMGDALLPDRDQTPIQPQPPVLMARFIPDEMDPTFKIKLHHLRLEYTIPSIMAFLGLGRDSTGGDLAGEMANSIANLAEQSTRSTKIPGLSPSQSDTPKASVKATKIAVVFRDCVIGLNPRNSPSKGLVVLSNSKFTATMHSQESTEALLDIRKASVMIIDDVSNVGLADNLHQRRSAVIQSNQVQAYINEGYVPVTTISSATAVVKVMQLAADGTKSLDVELRDDLLILDTCADSTQTLVAILNGLQPPTPPSVTAKYRTEVMPLQDMLASFTGDAFSADDSLPTKTHSETEAGFDETDSEGHLSDELEYVSDFYPNTQKATGSPGAFDANDLLDSFHSQYQISSSITELDFQEDHFAKQSAVGGTAHRWDSTHNTYGLSNDHKLQRSPLRVRVRDMHVIWNLFDGYDWQRTRDTISRAVKDVETKATERRARASRMSPDAEDEEESVIGDFLFNSIYIGIPANKDPRELHREINRDINDLASETGSYATTTTVTGATGRQGRPTSEREKKLRLNRSKQHKMTFELKGVCADLVVFPPGSGETQSSLDVRVRDLEIFDHVPTSTWKKFATYMHEAGERESGTSMVHLEILTVKPVPELAASEIVLKATVLPIRLIVDQDALEFMSRFFEFRDESVEPSSTPGDIPFLQRVEVNAIQVKLDFKPKRVDYAGLRSGRTTEFMNFFVLDGSDMVLRHVIIYGVSGFDRLGNTLNDIWMPDVKRNQLPGVLAGLAPIRSLVNVGGGVKDLVVVPMREYRKDGRIVRSIQKGALAFAKTTSNELVKLGAKLAIGTQTVLQGAEDLLTSPTVPSASTEEDREDEEEAKKISLYADQPIGVVQGLRGAFRGLERDLLLARDAIVAVPGEVVESGSAKAAAKAVWKRAPTVILRPAIGVSKAVGQTLLGAGNTLDPSNRRRMEDKYKRH